MVIGSRNNHSMYIYNNGSHKTIFSPEKTDDDIRGYSFYGNSIGIELFFRIVTNSRIYKSLCDIGTDDIIFFDIFHCGKISEKSFVTFCKDNIMRSRKNIVTFQKNAEKYFTYYVKESKKNKKVAENLLQYGDEMLYNIAIEFADIST